MAYEDEYAGHENVPNEWSEAEIIALIRRHSMSVESVREICEDVFLDLQDEKKIRIDDENFKKSSASEQVALLNELGFFDLPMVNKMTTTQQAKIVEKIINRDNRTARGQVNVLSASSDEDRNKYTSANDNTIKKVQGLIQNILNLTD